MKKIISVTVLPRSSKNEIVLLADGNYKIKITAPPVDGTANKKLIELISDFFEVSKSCVKIQKGETGRRKIIQIDFP